MNQKPDKLLVTKADRLVKLLTEQRRVLAVAGCDEALVDDYSAVIRFLRLAAIEDLRRIFPEPTLARKAAALGEPQRSETEIINMTEQEVAKIIDDEGTPRKELERIAIYRFRVPRGSMRSFSNRHMLVEKLSTLLHNEQAHTAIERVARGQGELPGVHSEKE